jgi:hypothetical protein
VQSDGQFARGGFLGDEPARRDLGVYHQPRHLNQAMGRIVLTAITVKP